MKKKLTQKKLTILALVLLLALLLAACGAEDAEESTLPEENDVVATVNGEDILGSTYILAYQEALFNIQQQGLDPTDEAVYNQLHEQTLESIIGHKLLSQDAIAKGYEASEEEVTEQIELLKASFEEEDEFYNRLEEIDMSLDELEVQIAIDIILGKYWEEEIEIREITEEEVQEFYDLAFGNAEDAPTLEEIEAQIRFTLEQQELQGSIAQRVADLKEDGVVETFI